eukprot:GHVR01142098.1.p1 GENE.GHVR01142098.1~~GHVR01142098.1.p1  ORF type:complete len:227 (+),score=58.79 GHVR01142098.1:21-701(+)
MEITAEEFDSKVSQKDEKLTVVLFHTTWHPPAVHMVAVMKPMTEDFNNCNFYQIDGDKGSDLMKRLGVQSVPTVLLIKQGNEISRVEGHDPQRLVSLVRQHSISTNTNSNNKDVLNNVVPCTIDDVNKRIESIIKSHDNILFMKGSKSNPFCKFSRMMIELLSNQGVEYDTFDILTDEKVRQGLKEYSNWPTFPQLYVKGEFVGGVDVVRDMQTDGSFDQVFTAKQ